MVTHERALAVGMPTAQPERGLRLSPRPVRCRRRGDESLIVEHFEGEQRLVTSSPTLLARDFDAPFLVRFEQGDVGIDHQFYQA